MDEINRERKLREAADKAYESGEMDAQEYAATRYEIDSNIQKLEAAKPDKRGIVFEVVGGIFLALGVVALLLGGDRAFILLLLGGLGVLIGRVSRR